MSSYLFAVGRVGPSPEYDLGTHNALEGDQGKHESRKSPVNGLISSGRYPGLLSLQGLEIVPQRPARRRFMSTVKCCCTLAYSDQGSWVSRDNRSSILCSVNRSERNSGEHSSHVSGTEMGARGFARVE